jgi:fluoroquinolone transport system permease protein
VRRGLAALRWEFTLQARHHFYSVTAVVTIVLVGILRLLPDVAREQPASLVPMFVLFNLQITAFYFAAALMLLERGQGVVAALLTSPLRPGQYLWGKALALALLGAAENLAIVLLAFGPEQGWGWLLLGTVLLALLYAFLGLAVVAAHSGINTFLIPSIGWIALFSLPLLGYYELIPRWTLAWHPMMPSLLLLEGSARPIAAAAAIYGILGGAGWCVAAFLWARYRLVQLVAPAAA